MPNLQAAVLNPDYSLNTPSNPAQVGTTVFAYLTGSGPVSPPAKDGTPAPLTSLVYAQASSSATIGGLPATVSFAGLAPGFIGEVQMNIIVPAGLAPDSYPLAVTIDGQTSNAAPITVK
jgi:adhesin/invasin